MSFVKLSFVSTTLILSKCNFLNLLAWLHPGEDAGDLGDEGGDLRVISLAGKDPIFSAFSLLKFGGKVPFLKKSRKSENYGSIS